MNSSTGKEIATDENITDLMDRFNCSAQTRLNSKRLKREGISHIWRSSDSEFQEMFLEGNVQYYDLMDIYLEPYLDHINGKTINVEMTDIDFQKGVDLVVFSKDTGKVILTINNKVRGPERWKNQYGHNLIEYRKMKQGIFSPDLIAYYYVSPRQLTGSHRDEICQLMIIDTKKWFEIEREGLVHGDLIKRPCEKDNFLSYFIDEILPCRIGSKSPIVYLQVDTYPLFYDYEVSDIEQGPSWNEEKGEYHLRRKVYRKPGELSPEFKEKLKLYVSDKQIDTLGNLIEKNRARLA